MSPEQIQGTGVDHRSDLFSLGVVLYEMLTGSLPFAGDYEPAVFYSILNLEPISLSTFGIEMPPGLETIVQRLLKKNPMERYQSAADLHGDLEMLLQGGGEEIQTLRESRAAKFIRFSRQSRLSFIFVLAVVAGGLIWSLIPHKSFSLDPSAYVIVADVENNTGNKFFDHSITEAIKVSLRQSPHINLLSPDRIAGALRRMRMDESHPLDERTAVAAAEREGARLVLAGGIHPLGTGFDLECKIIDPVSNETLRIPRRQVSRVEDVLNGVDALCGDIRNALGESLEQIAQNATPLEKVTTSSLEALELYSRGNEMERQGKYEEAAMLKGRAADIDSLFAMAVGDLSYIHRKLGHDSIALAYHRRVLPLLNRVTDRERYNLLEVYYGPSFEFDFPKALESMRELALRYPYDLDAHAELGHLAMYSCQLTTALQENDKALVLDPQSAGTIYNNSGYAAALAGDVDEALGYFRKSKHLRPTYYAIDTYIGHAFWAGEKFDSAEITLRAIIPRADPRRQILSHAQLATFYRAQGRLGQAEIECDSGIALCRQNKLNICTAYLHYLLGDIGFERGDNSAYLREMRLAEEYASPPYTELAMIGAHYAMTGHERDAQRLLSRIGTAHSLDPFFLRRQDHFLHWIRGEILLSQHDTRRAANQFEEIEKVHCGDPVYFSAQWGIARCSRSVSDSLAIQNFLRLIERPGELVMGPLLSYPSTGPWTSHFLPEANLALGTLYLHGNDTTDASRSISGALRYWQGADPAFREAREARSLMKQLQRSP
jgi:tetratricopeptide (TPR) repeat protein